jgi:membrane protease YdiL (CAAX protease family)
MQSPLDGAIFILVVILGAGIKEELQRAFVLRRFEQRLGRHALGPRRHDRRVWRAARPAGDRRRHHHRLPGLVLGVLYMKRQSAIMSMTNHAAFDAAQVAQYLIVRALGG